MSQLFLLPGSLKRDPAVEKWFKDHPGELGALAHHWFNVIRQRGDDVRELLHDGHPTACVAGAAFAYVNAFTSHVNVGFFRGAELADPDHLLEGAGKFMRHVKLRPGSEINATALTKLIDTAYDDMEGPHQSENLKRESPRNYWPCLAGANILAPICIPIFCSACWLFKYF